MEDAVSHNLTTVLQPGGQHETLSQKRRGGEGRGGKKDEELLKIKGDQDQRDLTTKCVIIGSWTRKREINGTVLPS